MTSAEAIAIRFDDGRAIPVEQAFIYADAHPGCWPSNVVWSDGFESYAKGWRTPEHKLCEVGAGAYGNMQILVRK